MTNTAALIAAAGQSQRMGTCKALLKFKDSTLIEYQLKILQKLNIENIFVTIPRSSEAICIKQLVMRNNATPILNIFNQQGLIGSVRSTLLRLSAKIDRLVVTPIDSPILSPELLSELIQHSCSYQACIPSYKNKKGHPIVIGKNIFSKLLTAEANLGMKHFLQKNRRLVKTVSWHQADILRNINTKNDLTDYAYFLKRSTALAPPNPKEFDIAKFTLVSLATLGT